MKRVHRFQATPDEQFVGEFREAFPLTVASSSDIIATRARVARSLGVPPARLGVPMTREFLAQQLSFLGEFQMAWSDLEEESADVSERRTSKAAVERSATVGELVNALLKSRSMIRDQSD